MSDRRKKAASAMEVSDDDSDREAPSRKREKRPRSDEEEMGNGGKEAAYKKVTERDMGHKFKDNEPSEQSTSELESLCDTSERRERKIPEKAREPVASSSSSTVEVRRGAARGKKVERAIPVTRPTFIETKKGQSGKELIVEANYFKLARVPQWSIVQYHVEFYPFIESIQVKKTLIYEHKQELGGYLFDGQCLYLTHKLPNQMTELKSKDIKILIKYVAVIPMTQQTSLQILNLVLRRAMEGLQLQLVGKHFFDASARVDVLDHRLQLWPGYYTSIRQHEEEILVCVEIAHKIMRTETVYDVLQSTLKNNGVDFQQAFRRFIVGITVLTDYNNKTYKVTDVDFNSSVSDSFETKQGQETYIDYYLRRYNIDIKDKKQPLLISLTKTKKSKSGARECIALVPELCRLTGVTEEMRTNFRLMRAVADYTRLDPKERIKKLAIFNSRLSRCTDTMDIFKEWGMELERKVVDIKARVLNPEIIIFGNDVRVENNIEADWTRHMKCNQMYSYVNLDNWALIYPQFSENLVREFIGALITTAKGMSFNIADPKVKKSLDDDRQGAYANAIDRCCDENPALIMCIVPNNRADRYAAIKKKSCVDTAIPTQVLLTKTITPKGTNIGSLFSVATKVAIQLNCKLGGIPWMINLPLSGLMTIGFDVCHNPSTLRHGRQSFGALVATMDLKISNKYFSTITIHGNGNELSNELSVNVLKAVRAYQNHHGSLPQRIMFYRDGVSDGLIEYIFKSEVKLIEIRLHEYYRANNAAQPPRFTFFIVNKRINTRIFARNNNPPPGTVVDDVITLPERYDFYLVSQSVRQGTVSPTNYNIIRDTSKLSPDRLQMLTYKMCHVYFNWCGTTRVPSVCQYAHKLAYLVGQFLQQPPSNLLEKQLYFL